MMRISLRSLIGSLLLGAMRTTINDIALFDAMPDDSNAAMRAGGSKFLNSAFEAIECVDFIPQIYLEGPVIIVPALVAFGHS